MRRWIYAAGLMAATPAQAAMMAPGALQALVEGFAGRPAMVDARLLLPACAAPTLAWSVGGASVVVACGEPDWRVFVPVGRPTAAVVASQDEEPVAAAGGPVIRRGDRVMVEAGGEGFVVGMETVAESDARDGRVLLRVAGGSRRLTGSIGADGRVRINGLNAMVKGR